MWTRIKAMELGRGEEARAGSGAACARRDAADAARVSPLHGLSFENEDILIPPRSFLLPRDKPSVLVEQRKRRLAHPPLPPVLTGHVSSLLPY